MTILTPGINGFEQQPQQDPRAIEQTLTEGERLELAQQRSLEVNLFSGVDESTRYHQENISHLLTEEKYQAFLPVMLSSVVPGQVAWAPHAGVHVTDTIREFKHANGHTGIYSDYLQHIENQLEDDIRLSAMRRQEIISSANSTAPIFNFVPRLMVEYNPKFVQLCVVVVVRQGDKYLLLRTPDVPKARVRNKLTFIQGHVEIENDVNNMSAMQYLVREAGREINEEVQGLGELTQYLEYKGLFHDSSEPVSQEHISAMFEIVIPEDVQLNIETNEEDKHSARFYTREEVLEENVADNIVEFILGL